MTTLLPYLVLVVLLISPIPNRGEIAADEQSFHHFITTYNKTYVKNSSDYQHRFQIFRDSLKRHDLLNSKTSGGNAAVYGINQFSDLTPQEFQEIYLSKTDASPNTTEHRGRGGRPTTLQGGATPKTWDWRDKKVVSSIVNQESCGACWAIAVIECLESQWKIAGNELPTLSIQQLTDCSNNNQGCSGGDICAASQWLNVTGAKIVENKIYPFVKKTTTCKTFPSSTWGVSVSDYICGKYDEDESVVLSLLSSHGPVAVAVDATSWQDYLGGIIQYHCSASRRNHAVQIVGYNISSEIPYYIVRNSWGSGYGHDGYLYVKYGGNVCGISSRVASLFV